MERFKALKTGYRFDKRIFQMAIAFLILIVFFEAYQQGFNFNRKFYLKCSSPTCENPFYDARYNDFAFAKMKKVECDFCDQKIISKGEYGDKPSFISENIWLIALCIIGSAFLINHRRYNKGIKMFEGDLIANSESDSPNSKG